MNNHSINTKLTWALILFACCMFGFCYALVPLYNTFCKYTGLQGKLPSGRTRVPTTLPLDKTRTITIEFITQVNQDIPWQFYSLTKSIPLHPGELKKYSSLPRIGLTMPLLVRQFLVFPQALLHNIFIKHNAFVLTDNIYKLTHKL